MMPDFYEVNSNCSSGAKMMKVIGNECLGSQGSLHENLCCPALRRVECNSTSIWPSEIKAILSCTWQSSYCIGAKMLKNSLEVLQGLLWVILPAFKTRPSLLSCVQCESSEEEEVPPFGITHRVDQVTTVSFKVNGKVISGSSASEYF